MTSTQFNKAFLIKFNQYLIDRSASAYAQNSEKAQKISDQIEQIRKWEPYEDNEQGQNFKQSSLIRLENALGNCQRLMLEANRINRAARKELIEVSMCKEDDLEEMLRDFQVNDRFFQYVHAHEDVDFIPVLFEQFQSADYDYENECEVGLEEPLCE